MPEKKDQPEPPKKLQKRMWEIEVEQAELELYKTRLEVAKQECETTEAIYQQQQIEAEETRKGIFSLVGGIGAQGADYLRDQLMAYGRTSEGGPITLIISSGGGDAFASFMLYDTLRTLSKQGHKVTTIIRGWAASGAGVIAMAGDRRLMGSESYLMLHEAATLTGGKASDIGDEAALLKRMSKQMAGIYGQHCKKMTAQEIHRKMLRTDWWVDAKEAKRLGFITEIN